MPANPKIFIKGTLVEISSRIEHGLPLVPNEITNKLIVNVLARAQTFYPVSIVNYVVMKNHFHTLIVVKDPADVPKFVEYFKRETSHFINRLLGKRQNTLWVKRYFSPVILDVETAIDRLKYISLNPAASGLVNNSKEWILSSEAWVAKNRTSSEIIVKRISRAQVKKLPAREMTVKEIKSFADKIEFRGKETYKLKIEPHAWIECFNESKFGKKDNLKQFLEQEIKKEEKRLALMRTDPPPPIDKLKTGNIREEHEPTKFSPKVFCLGKDKKTRIKYIGWVKELLKCHPGCKKETSDPPYRTHYPPGFFAPGGFLSANFIPDLTPMGDLG